MLLVVLAQHKKNKPGFDEIGIHVVDDPRNHRPAGNVDQGLGLHKVLGGKPRAPPRHGYQDVDLEACHGGE